MAEPIVVEGSRGPEARGMYRREQGLPVEESLLKRVTPAQQGEAVFVSPNPQYRIVLWEDWDKTSVGRNGRRIPDRREAQFRSGIYRTRDAREITALRNSGSNGVWYFERAQLEKMAQEAKLSAAMLAADDPQVAEALRTKLGIAEMPLPPAPKTEHPTTAKEVLKPLK